MLHVADQLSKVDGYADWREKEAQDLSDLVQKRLHNLQNPPDCASARKLVCNLNKVCNWPINVFERKLTVFFLRDAATGAKFITQFTASS